MAILSFGYHSFWKYHWTFASRPSSPYCEPNGASVLCAHIWTLQIESCGIMDPEKDIKDRSRILAKVHMKLATPQQSWSAPYKLSCNSQPQCLSIRWHSPLGVDQTFASRLAHLLLRISKPGVVPLPNGATVVQFHR